MQIPFLPHATFETHTLLNSKVIDPPLPQLLTLHTACAWIANTSGFMEILEETFSDINGTLVMTATDNFPLTLSHVLMLKATKDIFPIAKAEMMHQARALTVSKCASVTNCSHHLTLDTMVSQIDPWQTKFDTLCQDIHNIKANKYVLIQQAKDKHRHTTRPTPNIDKPPPTGRHARDDQGGVYYEDNTQEPPPLNTLDIPVCYDSTLSYASQVTL